MMRETKTLKGLFPEPRPPRRKNFIKENMKSLRKMEQVCHANNDAKDLKLPILRHPAKVVNKCNKTNITANSINNIDTEKSKPEDVIENGMARLMIKKSALNDSHNRKKSAPVVSHKKPIVKKGTRSSLVTNGSLVRKTNGCRDQLDHKSQHCRKFKACSDVNDECDKKEKLDVVNNSNESDLKCKNQGVQTIDIKDINTLYSEGVIRYPSARSKEGQQSKTTDAKETSEESESKYADNNKNVEELSHDDIDYMRLNKERTTVASKLTSQLSPSAPPPSYRIGVVPKYIKERKEALEREKQAKAAAKHTDCPPGHVPLPDNERRETLSMLKKSKN